MLACLQEFKMINSKTIDELNFDGIEEGLNMNKLSPSSYDY